MSENQRFPKSSRLRRQAEFDRVYFANYFAADHVLVVKGISGETSETRLGMSIGRKVGNAVVRNRWKRVIRDVFRKIREELPSGLDIVVRPKRGATCDYQQIERSLPKLVRRIHRNITRDRKNKPTS